MRDFRELMRAPGLGRIIASQLFARFPAGMYSLGLLMHVENAKGNYTEAGLVLAAFSIGMAVAGPIVARQLSRVGTLPVLLSTLLVSCGAIVAVSLFPHLTLPALMGLAALGGAAMPPVIPTVRTLYPRLTPRRLLTSLFSVDAALQEIIWVIGPVLITLLVATLGSTPAMLTVVAIQLAGGLLFLLDPLVRGLKIPPATQKFGRVLRNPSVILMTVATMLLIGAFSAVEAATVAWFPDGSINPGLALAICSVGSLVGGIATGSRPISRWSFALRLMVIVVGISLAAAATGFWTLSGALFVAGLGMAPALAAVSSVIAGSVDFSETAEAYGWIGTGQLLGASIGSALAGVAIDNLSAQGGILVAAGIGLMAVLVAAVFRKAQPDLTIDFLDD